MSKVGRPSAQIDKHQFEQLCALQCTELEFCTFFYVTDKTLNNWCKKNYNMNFSEVFKLKRGKGLISLRRSQFKMAETNPTMAIWLGKQYLGQSEHVVAELSKAEKSKDPLTLALESLEGDNK